MGNPERRKQVMHNLYTFKMLASMTDLRKQAYRLWNVDASKVIYNFPRSAKSSGREFVFQLDYENRRSRSWPRAYALSVGEDEPEVRIVTPILAIKSQNEKDGVYTITTDLTVPMWVDFPIEIHEQMIRLVAEGDIKRYRSRCKRMLGFAPYTQVPKESYIFGVSQINNKLSIRLIDDVSCYTA